MSATASTALTDTASNVVENLAVRVAARNGGRITANHLAPYLPLSLGLIRDSLDHMVDGHSVLSANTGAFPAWEFPTVTADPAGDGPLQVETCLGCTERPAAGDDVLCRDCATALETELARLADRTPWPAEAIYEHEILYLAGQGSNPHYAPDLASRSRYTLKRLRDKLKKMTLRGYVAQKLDEAKASIAYTFPPVPYPRERYAKNLAVIRRFPASAAEEMEMRLTRIFLAVAVFLAGLFVLGFLHVPPVALVGLGVLGIPAIALWIWTRREPQPAEGGPEG